MISSLRRHDMLFLKRNARMRIADVIRQSNLADALRMADAYLADRIPGIVRRGETCDGDGIGIGISFPIRSAGSRLRFATTVSEAEISEVFSPYAVTHLPFEARLKPLQVLNEVKRALPGWEGRLGVYGACALQILTGLSYVHEGSDLDLVFAGGTPETLFAGQRILRLIEESSGISIDAEVIIGGSHGLKLKELVSEQKTVLAKTRNSVEILIRQNVLQALTTA